MRRQKGFTLIEVLVALFILTGAILVITSAWSGNMLRIRKTALFNDVATLLETKMVEMEAKYKDKPFNEIADEAGDFGSEYPRYRWEMKVNELKLPDMTPLLVQDDGADETLISMMKQVTEYLSQVIKEVKVTVFVKSKGKELEFSATQYFIDYEKPFTAGAPAGDDGGGG